MAISFSPRVRRNLAQQMAFSHRVSSATSSRYSIQALLLISNEVAVPTQSSELFNYLNTCLNNSPHDGTAGAMTSGNKFKDLAKFYDSLDKKTKHLIVSRTKISDELYEEKRDREFYFFADEGKELGVVDKIIGVDCELDDVI